MSIQQLPIELLENVFRNVALSPLKKSTLISCAQVCRSWYLPACRILYEKLAVTNLGQIFEVLTSQKNNRGMYCKELRFTGMYEREPSSLEVYQQILSYVPNIKTITLDSCTLRSRHLQQLALYPELIKNVKAIILTGDWHSGELQDFYHCATAFKDNIQRMMLNALGETITTADGKFGNIITFLPDFTSLTTLQIKNGNSIYVPGLPQLSMFSVLRSCPNLVSFSIENDFQEPEDDDICTFKHNSLRCLDIKVPEITKNQINYLVNNITQLNQFKLKCGAVMNHRGSIKWMEKIGPDHLSQFERYLARIDKVDLFIGENFQTRILEFWPFISNVVSNSRSTPTNIYIMVNIQGLTCLVDRKFVLTKHAESTDLQCRLSGHTPPLIDLLTSPVLLSAIVPPTNLGRNKISSLHLCFQSRWDNPDPIYPHRLNIFENIINCFTNILDFSIKEDPSYSSSFQIKVASNDIKDVQFDLLNNCLKINSPRLPTTPEDRLSYVTLQRIRSSEDITSLLHLLPNTKHLKILECPLTQNEDYNYPIDMNTLFLKRLTLDITKLASEGSGQLTYVLQIEERNLNRTLCYKWKRESKKFDTMVFESVESSFLTQYRRFSSSRIHVIIIQCQRLEEIHLYVKRLSRRTWQSDCYINATVNLPNQ